MSIVPRITNIPLDVPTADDMEEGELVLNTVDGKLYTKLASGEVYCVNERPADPGPQIAAAKDAAIVGAFRSVFEQGEWTPRLMCVSDGTTAAVIQPVVTYDTDRTYGRWTRIGSMLYASGRIRSTDWPTAGAGHIVITGFPFPCRVAPYGDIEMASGFVGWATSNRSPLAGLYAYSQYDAYFVVQQVSGSRIVNRQAKPDDVRGGGSTARNNDMVFSYMYEIDPAFL